MANYHISMWKAQRLPSVNFMGVEITAQHADIVAMQFFAGLETDNLHRAQQFYQRCLQLGCSQEESFEDIGLDLAAERMDEFWGQDDGVIPMSSREAAEA